MHTPSFAEYVDCLDRGDLRGIADLMLESALKLASTGADFLICPDNTIHSAFSLVEPNSPRPWLHIAAVVADEAVSRGFRRVGLTGTRWLVESSVYPELFTSRGLEVVRPSETERQEIHRIIMGGMVPRVFLSSDANFLQGVIPRMASHCCDSVGLACTGILLIINDQNSS